MYALISDGHLHQRERLAQAGIEACRRARHRLGALVPVALLQRRVAERPGKAPAEAHRLGIRKDAVKILAVLRQPGLQLSQSFGFGLKD